MVLGGGIFVQGQLTFAGSIIHDTKPNDIYVDSMGSLEVEDCGDDFDSIVSNRLKVRGPGDRGDGDLNNYVCQPKTI